MKGNSIIAIAVFLAAIVGANLSAAHFGPAVTPVNAFLLIGLDLSLRDYLHDRWNGKRLWPKMGLLLISGGLLAYVFNREAGQIALASCVAFVASGIVDAIAYHALRKYRFFTRANGSNLAGAAIDSILFPTIAFGGFMPLIVLGQFAAKVGGGLLWSIFFQKLKGRRMSPELAAEEV